MYGTWSITLSDLLLFERWNLKPNKEHLPKAVNTLFTSLLCAAKQIYVKLSLHDQRLYSIVTHELIFAMLSNYENYESNMAVVIFFFFFYLKHFNYFTRQCRKAISNYQNWDICMCVYFPIWISQKAPLNKWNLHCFPAFYLYWDLGTIISRTKIKFIYQSIQYISSEKVAKSLKAEGADIMTMLSRHRFKLIYIFFFFLFRRLLKCYGN